MRIRALRRWRKIEENRGSWRHVFYKVRSELKKLMGSDAGRLARCVIADLRRHRHRQLSQVVGVDIDSGDPTRGVDAGDTNPIDFINGTVVLMKKNVLDFNDLNASVLDGVYELVGQWVSLQLISAVHADDSITT
ncbi:hypothetical protein PS2_007891 [Malus domestica]